jgi:hypothetical protein
LFGDIRHHRHDATRFRPATVNPIHATIRRVVFERLVRGVAKARHPSSDECVDVALPVVAAFRQKTQEVGIRATALNQLARSLVHFFEAIITDDDVQVVIRVDNRARHFVQSDMELGFLLLQFLLSLLLLGDIRHDRHDAARLHAAAVNPVHAAIRRAVFERLVRGVAKACHPPGDERFGIPSSVVAVRCQKAQEVRVWATGRKQLTWGWIHFSEAIIAEDDVQIVIRVDERAGHVVEGDLKLGLGCAKPPTGLLALDVCARHEEPLLSSHIGRWTWDRCRTGCARRTLL